MQFCLSAISMITMNGTSTGEYNKTGICKMAVSRFVEVTDKEIRKIKINSVPKNTKYLSKNLGEYSLIITSPSVN